MNLKLFLIISFAILVTFFSGFFVGQSSFFTSKKSNPFPLKTSSEDMTKIYKRTAILKGIKENAKEIQKCYLEHLEKNPKTKEGIVRFIIKLNDDGSVMQAKVTKSDFETSIANCTVEKVKRIFFSPPPPEVNRVIEHEIAYKSQESFKNAQKELKEDQLPKARIINLKD